MPERKSLSLINAFFLSDPGKTPNKTHSPPFVKFKDLLATSSSKTESDAKLKDYLGLQMHLIRYEDLWNVLDVNRMCATSDDVREGVSDAVDHLIVGKAGRSSDTYGYQLRFKEKQPDAKLMMNKPGWKGSKSF